jgi:hypothetical protein
LHEARRHRADDLAEGRVIDVAVNGIRAEELCVIECVERFQTEFEHFGLGEVGIFQQRNIPIVHSRPIKEPARGRTGRAERWRAEKRCNEIRPAVSRIVIELQRAGGNIEVSEPVAVHSVVEASDQAVSLGLTSVTGSPLLKRVIPEIAQPRVARLLWWNNFANGRSYV